MSLEAAAIGTSVGGQAIGSLASLFGGREQADRIHELGTRNAQAVLQANQANERRQRRVDQAIEGRHRARIATSGFTTRGTPLEQAADLAAGQMENRLLRRFEARASAQDIRFRADVAADQAEAQGIAGFLSGLGGISQTVLSRIQPTNLFEVRSVPTAGLQPQALAKPSARDLLTGARVDLEIT